MSGFGAHYLDNKFTVDYATVGGVIDDGDSCMPAVGACIFEQVMIHSNAPTILFIGIVVLLSILFLISF